MVKNNCPFAENFDCFGRNGEYGRNTRCMVLEDTDFGDKTECPFYKSKPRFISDRARHERPNMYNNFKVK